MGGWISKNKDHQKWKGVLEANSFEGDGSKLKGVSGTSFWARVGTVLSPATADDTITVSGALIQDEPGDHEAAPSLAFGDGDTGFYEISDDNLYLTRAGVDKWQWTVSKFGGIGNFKSELRTGTPTATAPGFAFDSDTNTGIGRAAADKLSLIAGGVEGVRVTTTGTRLVGAQGSAAFLLGAGGDAIMVLDALNDDSTVILKSSGNNKASFGWDNGLDAFRIYNYGTSNAEFKLDASTGNITIAKDMDVLGAASAASMTIGAKPVITDETSLTGSGATTIYGAFPSYTIGSSATGETDPIFMAASASLNYVVTEIDPEWNAASAAINTHIASTAIHFTMPSLDQIGNPAGNKTFTMANKTLAFTWAAPTDIGLELDATGGFTGDLIHIHQHGGNPGTTNLLAIEAEDSDVTLLKASGAGVLTIDQGANLETSGRASAASMFVGANAVLTSFTEADPVFMAQSAALGYIATGGEADPLFMAASNVLIDAHEGDASDPHGATLTQTTINAGTGTITTDTDASGAARVRNILIGTEAEPGSADNYTQGTIYLQYTA